ncbi:CidA/LrgA family protein [Psychromonas sp. RZ22]|uniref:CidA/LrgA family protein n=1 Tax=Psychromonas algarum TaxID=2555643 RepID=UPI00106768BA|nr:CidA/LrgA family protein [Psychromonas sp. RZ22]TEW54386.1 CidA/LrgA family protein [Psychromonas sp. RZ22]
MVKQVNKHPPRAEEQAEIVLSNDVKNDKKLAAAKALNKKQDTARFVKNSLQILLGLLIIMLFLSIAKVIIGYFQSTFPASILAMLMLFVALSLGVVKLTWIEFTGNLILKYLALLFIPVGVGLINYFDLIAAHWLVIVFSLFFTTLLTMFLVGHCYQWLVKEEK